MFQIEYKWDTDPAGKLENVPGWRTSIEAAVFIVKHTWAVAFTIANVFLLKKKINSSKQLIEIAKQNDIWEKLNKNNKK